ncbi:MAG: ligand-binding sensor domain-containing protein, partial [Ignavibacterium sp.]
MKIVRNYKLLFVCIFITHLNFIQAQYFSHSSYTIKDGLPSDIITTIFQDRKGYIWLGTNNGLSVYNAKYFRNFSVVDGLSNNWITTINESPYEPGTIWIGTIAGGLNKYKDGKFEKYSFNSNSDSNNVGSIAFDSDGVLWFTTYYGLWKLKDDKIFKVNEFSAPNKPQLIISGREGNLCCA